VGSQSGRRVVVTPGPRPWWASDGEAAAVEPVDPLEAHRAARRGPAPAEGPAAWWDRSTDDPQETVDHDSDDDLDGDAAASGAHRPDVCGVCPICVAMRALGETRPQLVEHLTEAARHLAAALRSVVDEAPGARGDGPAEGGRPGRDPLERIDLD
jgi:hypothetical protein